MSKIKDPSGFLISVIRYSSLAGGRAGALGLEAGNPLLDRREPTQPPPRKEKALQAPCHLPTSSSSRLWMWLSGARIVPFSSLGPLGEVPPPAWAPGTPEGSLEVWNGVGWGWRSTQSFPTTLPHIYVAIASYICSHCLLFIKKEIFYLRLPCQVPKPLNYQRQTSVMYLNLNPLCLVDKPLFRVVYKGIT